ncbi:nucleolar complex-associated protein 3 [Aspergillus heteromorphus CBS 117.55]|uniref:Nucleolar complex-associated protein 3 n=1 Tax=Aspergillus heteromorphus CBS 117.55 TaxID=1448321 RepID=A0A317V805_9EURO|nr:nucleolar complex-associated protein 3 [Aspergillus heteromorphus CBS 117.55]PWY69138.1 nucleolar complex-associated protein 3 [Aspergillus heteromorphus CBS 117.55]
MAPGRTTKRRRVSPPAEEDKGSKSARAAPIGDFHDQAAEWDLEQDYERRPRKVGKKDQERTRLPIKTDTGLQNVEEPEAVEDESDSFLGTDDDDEEMEDADSDDEEEVEEEKPKIPLKLQIIQAKEDLAKYATLINEDPEEHLSTLRAMAEMVDNASHVTIAKLAIAAQAAVYKDVIPGYRIRPLSDEDMSSKISKEVRKLRSFEQTLLSNYKRYIQKLGELTKPSKNGAQVDAGLKSIAINCACSLLLSVPHFNFRAELLKILVNRLARRQVDADFAKCRETMEEVFQRDQDGIVSLEAVRMLSKMMKAKEFRMHDSVLDTFLYLRLLSEFSAKASRDHIEREPEEENTFGKKPKQKREFRTKRERKVQKERKIVEKDMKEADALVSHEERDKNQAETLKLVFGIYFRILKLRIPALMGPVLEGLAKYAHLINQDFFGDLLEALKELIAHADHVEEQEGDDAEDSSNDDDDEPETTRDAHREALLCTVTAFALLEGQDASKAAGTLHLDLSFFIKHLYRSLYTLSINPDVEYNPDKSLRLPDPNAPEDAAIPRSRNKVNFQTPMVLLLRCLQSTLLSRAHGIAPPVRVGSFSKRLMTSSLQLPEKSAIATLSLMTQVAKHNARRISSLWHSEERKGDGVFNAYAADIEATNVFAGTVWEGELLRQHYCPQIRDAALDIEKMILTRK